MKDDEDHCIVTVLTQVAIKEYDCEVVNRL